MTESAIDFYSQINFGEMEITKKGDYNYSQDSSRYGIQVPSDIVIVKKNHPTGIIWSSTFEICNDQYRLLGGICKDADGKVGDVQIIDWSRNCCPDERLRTYSEENGGTITKSALSKGQFVGEALTCFLIEFQSDKVTDWYESEVQKALEMDIEQMDSTLV